MKLYNGRIIIAGIIVFVIVITFPFWYNRIKSVTQPTLSLETPAILQLKERRCVEDTSFMRTNHMKLIVTWREGVVREGNRFYTTADGRIFEASLSGTCLKCHSNKQQFCDSCHNYVGVKPSCFSCHIIPQEVK